jgi:tetratricopeptide (TPR) repeat protein
MSDGGYSPEEIRKRKFASDCFKRGTEAMAKQNWDYAVEMFLTSVKLSADNLVYRQSLRGCERKKYKDNKTGASMAFLKLSSIRSKIKKARSAKNWVEMDIAAEEGLTVNPWDGQFNADLGEAAVERGFLEIAAFAYETATSADSAPKNKDFLIALAHVQELRKNYNAAIVALEKAQALDPLDGTIRSKIHALGASSTIHRGGYDEAKTTHEVKQDKPKQGYEDSVKGNVKTNNEVLAPGESEEADLKRMIRKEPANVAYYLKLADLYRREGKLEDSAKTFQQALEVSGDANIREQMEDVELDMVRRNLNFAKEAARLDADNQQTRAVVVELAKELLQQEIEVLGRRVDRYPSDLKLKNELARRYMKAKEFDKAIPLLQAASKDIRQEAQVLASLGTCFLAKKQNNLAKRQFEKALEKLNFEDHPIPFKECHYYLGRLAEEAADLPEAEKHYTEILGVDYDYKDVGERLRKIQGGDGTSNQIETGDTD